MRPFNKMLTVRHVPFRPFCPFWSEVRDFSRG
jgi:hypothetical protein